MLLRFESLGYNLIVQVPLGIEMWPVLIGEWRYVYKMHQKQREKESYKKSIPAMMLTARFSLRPRRPKYLPPLNILTFRVMFLSIRKMW